MIFPSTIVFWGRVRYRAPSSYYSEGSETINFCFRYATLNEKENEKAITTSDISKVFCEFFQTLYSSKVILQRTWSSFLILFICQSFSHREALEKPLILDKLKTVAASSPNNKALGTDGLKGEVYKTYGDILLPKLLEVFNMPLRWEHFHPLCLRPGHNYCTTQARQKSL